MAVQEPGEVGQAGGDGRVRFTNVVPGRYELAAWGTGYARAYQSLAIGGVIGTNLVQSSDLNGSGALINPDLAASDGLKVSTGRATYDNTAGLVRVPGAVSFSRGRMSGRSVGAIRVE